MRHWIATLAVVSLSSLAAGAEGLAAGAQPADSPAEVMKELRRVQAAVLRGESDAMRLEFGARAKERPRDPMPRVYLAWIQLPSDEAWNQLKGIAAIHPDNPWVHFGMGRIYVKWKMKDQARTEVQGLLKKDPGFYPAWMVEAELAVLQEDWPAAEAQYRKVLAAAEDPEARAGLGLALLRQGRKEEALGELKRAVQAYPEQPAALGALVPLLVEARDPAAVDAAQSAVDLKPRDREARRLLADLRFDAGDTAAAARDYEALARLGSAEPAVLARLAGLYRQAGSAPDEDRALALLAAADPGRAEAPARRAELALQAKDQALAEAQLKEALKREPARVEALSRLAKLELDLGRPVEALELSRRWLAAEPAAPGAKAQVESLEASFKLPRKPLKAAVQGVYWVLSGSLDRFYAERRAVKPALAGKVRVKVHIGADGTVSAVDVLEDTLQDPLLLGHVYFTLRDATYQERKVDPVVDFELGKKK